ncbi:uncharacterized protein L203_102296 [Cryptococcus depauperatus CBS 7841]|uniref:Uncharacterized protein n=1 Tax=Cryptococcus depauperatus CBS 7841 TaxID=1295531 RepID=A0A1E3IA69_9TREE|nr:hypothetical protein L203_04753 [Cryptococcus depauperatus CBS 7841]
MDTSLNDSQSPSQGGSAATSMGGVNLTTGQPLSANPDSHANLSGIPVEPSLRHWTKWSAEEALYALNNCKQAPDSLNEDLEYIRKSLVAISRESDRINIILDDVMTSISNAKSQRDFTKLDQVIQDLERTKEAATLQKELCEYRQQSLGRTTCEVGTYAKDIEKYLVLSEEYQSAMTNGRPSLDRMAHLYLKYGRKRAPSDFSTIMDQRAEREKAEVYSRAHTVAIPPR